MQNLYDKYDDLLREGKTEEAAYNIAVAGVGDISPLLEELERSCSGHCRICRAGGKPG